MAFYRDRDLATFAKEVTSDGIGIGGGFVVGGLVGRQVENMLIKTPVTDTSTLTQKLAAWGANNGAKFVLYYLAKHYDANSPMTKEATKALAGSVVYDTILRLANNGVNMADVSIGGYRILGKTGDVNVQKLVQENSILRTELNKALQKLAGVPGGTHPDTASDYRYAGEDEDLRRKYGSAAISPDVAERNRKYGAMPFIENPDKTSRERRFGFASTNPHDDNTRLKMFNMQ